jgi:hypothetical protein
MPPNCRFEIVDAEAEWTYRPVRLLRESFDMIEADSNRTISITSTCETSHKQ